MNKERIQDLITQLIIELEGSDKLRPETFETPKRVANAYMEIFEGYEQDLNKSI